MVINKLIKLDEVKNDSVAKGDVVVLEFDKDNTELVDDVIANPGASFVVEDKIVE